MEILINLKNSFYDHYLNEFVEVYLEKEGNNERKKLLMDVKFTMEKSDEKYFVRLINLFFYKY